jgi:hypothetical protein
VDCTAPFTIVQNGKCVACGGVGERCCQGNTCTTGTCGQNQQGRCP